jgi:hypothetical protein
MKEIELRLTKEIAEVKTSIIKWVVGLIAGQTIVLLSALIAILKTILH